MSHLKERNEKECLNCNAIIYGRFCHVCGQENLISKEPFLHLVTHFIYDIIHFDGKFFDTLKYLLLRPGFLAYEYMRGRRNSYLNPIKMYIFTSAIFFLIYFSISKSEAYVYDDDKQYTSDTNNNDYKSPIESFSNGFIEGVIKGSKEKDTLTAALKLLNDSIKYTTDSAKKKALITQQNLIDRPQKIIKNIVDISIKDEPYRYKKTTGSPEKDTIQNKPNDLTEKNNEQQQMPAKSNISNDIKSSNSNAYRIRTLSKKSDTSHNETKNNEKFDKFFQRIFQDKKLIQAKIPQVMFVTLPLMALILQLLYGRQKQFFYVNHIIFIINLYIGVYLIILLEMGFSYLHKISHYDLFGFFASLLSMGTFFYTYKSLRNFYLQGRAKTIFKCFLLFTLFTIIAVLTYVLVAAIPFSVLH
ncbi:MAG: DUF3667 domain-containing protein [Deinococcales bacterium]|nr:DUF3667 domain-containing protein [Chitinophagaceae bacterium]